MATTLTFPAGFVFGAATAAHQIEGQNVSSDWWAWEHAEGTACEESSGDAMDSWHRWPDDVALAAGMGLDCYRFSVEWARVEPAPGEISRAALDHYRRQAAACREAGVEPMVTLCHFTLPQWVAAQGGWVDARTPELFERYVRHMASALEGIVETFFTLNEPNVVATLGYYQGRYPPGLTERYDLAWKAHENQRSAHTRAVGAVKSAVSGAKVGLTLSMDDWQPLPGGQDMVKAIQGTMEDPYLELAKSDDLIGCQVYTRQRVGPTGPVEELPPGAKLTQLDTEFYPQALANCVRRTWDFMGGVTPILVTENGLATDVDADRIDYTCQALEGLHGCLSDGIDVCGYLHWSLVDNYEWDLGFRATLGLHSVDPVTFERTAKPSAAYLSHIARTKTMEVPA